MRGGFLVVEGSFLCMGVCGFWGVVAAFGWVLGVGAGGFVAGEWWGFVGGGAGQWRS